MLKPCRCVVPLCIGRCKHKYKFLLRCKVVILRQVAHARKPNHTLTQWRPSDGCMMLYDTAQEAGQVCWLRLWRAVVAAKCAVCSFATGFGLQTSGTVPRTAAGANLVRMGAQGALLSSSCLRSPRRLVTLTRRLPGMHKVVLPTKYAE
jgi:hypothetical protein